MSWFSRAAREVANTFAIREEPVVIASFNKETGAYTIYFRGAEVGPVWSKNDVVHYPGETVVALVHERVIIGLVP